LLSTRLFWNPIVSIAWSIVISAKNSDSQERTLPTPGRTIVHVVLA
jgi:hypothetical protein